MDDKNQFVSGSEPLAEKKLNAIETTVVDQSKRKKYYVTVLALTAVFLFFAYQFYTGYLASQQSQRSDIPTNKIEVKPVKVLTNEQSKLINSKLLTEAYKRKAGGYVFPEFKIKDTEKPKEDAEYIKVYLDLGAKIVSMNTVEYASGKLGIFAELKSDDLDIKNMKLVVKQKFEDSSWKFNKSMSSDTAVFYEIEKDGILFQVSQYLENGLQKIIIQSIEQK